MPRVSARRVLAIVVLATTALSAGALAVTAATPEPIPCEWYPPGWPEDPQWESLDWVVLLDDPACDAIQEGWDNPTDDSTVEEQLLPGEPGYVPLTDIQATDQTEIGEPLIVEAPVAPKPTLPATDTAS